LKNLEKGLPPNFLDLNSQTFHARSNEYVNCDAESLLLLLLSQNLF
jgi:hypothetical protein